MLHLIFCKAMSEPANTWRQNDVGLTKATNTVDDPLTMVRLWTHEMLRVFHDRLTDDKDRLWIGKLTCEMLELHFKEKASRVLSLDGSSDQNLLAGMRGLLFADFMTPGADPKCYRYLHSPVL